LDEDEFYMQLEPLQIHDEQKQFVQNAIATRLKKMSEFAKTCELEANRSSGFKRKGRLINGILGGLTALIGVTIAALPSNEIWPIPILNRISGITQVNTSDISRSLGLFGAITGSVIGTIGQFLDPTKSRQRAIDLQLLKVKLSNLTEENQIIFLGLKNTNPDTIEFINLNKSLMEEFTNIQKEAFEQGVNI
jgi:hypothetical protein